MVKMTKEKIKEIISSYTLEEEDIECIFGLVSELLQLNADELKETEPYAIVTIKKLEDASYEVWNLLDEVEKIMDFESCEEE